MFAACTSAPWRMITFAAVSWPELLALCSGVQPCAGVKKTAGRHVRMSVISVSALPPVRRVFDASRAGSYTMHQQKPPGLRRRASSSAVLQLAPELRSSSTISEWPRAAAVWRSVRPSSSLRFSTRARSSGGSAWGPEGKRAGGAVGKRRKR